MSYVIAQDRYSLRFESRKAVCEAEDVRFGGVFGAAGFLVEGHYHCMMDTVNTAR